MRESDWGIVKSSHLRCELSTIPQSDFRTCCFLFPWVPFSNFPISRLSGFAYYYWKSSLMVGLSNERDRKLISLRTSEWDLGKRFSKVTVVIQDYVAFLSRSLMNSHCYSVNTEHSRTLLFSFWMHMEWLIMKYVCENLYNNYSGIFK